MIHTPHPLIPLAGQAVNNMDARHFLVAATEDWLIDWLQTIPGFVHQLEYHQTTDELATANQLHGRCQDYLSLLLSLYRRATELVPDDEDVQSDILELIKFIGSYDAHY